MDYNFEKITDLKLFWLIISLSQVACLQEKKWIHSTLLCIQGYPNIPLVASYYLFSLLILFS